MVTALLVIAILVFLIVVHELGHFIVAKLFRVRVEEFGVGYPPRAFTFGKIGTTEYTLNWIPFGGFVRLYGDIGEEQHGVGSFVDANRAVQALILIAGVAMNAVAAWALFAGALHAGVPRVVESAASGQEVRLVVANVVEGSPAASAGIVPGDEIVSVSGEGGEMPAELSPQAFADFVRVRGGEPIALTYLHASETITTTLVPAHAVVPEDVGRPAVGVALYLLSANPMPWGEAVREAAPATLNAFRAVGNGLKSILERALSGQSDFSEIVGPVGLVGIVGDAAESGIGSVLMLAGFISVNLAIINLIPIPALDGGRLVLVGVEALLRRQVPRIATQLLGALGIALIVLLMITVTFNDIARLIS